jgi:hypothetical protein
MKNLLKPILILALMTLAFPSQSNELLPVSTAYTGVINQLDADRLTRRLEEIKSMDKRTLTAPERRALRKEVKAIKKVNSSGGGIYLSVGAVIIIILLLILLL